MRLSLIKKILILVCILHSNISYAEQRFSCKAASISGEFSDFNFKKYVNTYPTILINFQSGNLIFLYYEHDQRWERVYNIVKHEGSILIAIQKFQADWISIIHMDTQQKTFTTFFAGATGNTMSFGICD